MVGDMQCDLIVMENRLAEVEQKLFELTKPKKTVKKVAEKKPVEKKTTKKAK